MRTLLFCLSLVLTASASDWPRYRGPNGTGVSDETGLPSEISPDKNLVWKVKTPKGNSSPVIVGNRIFLTGEDGEERLVVCLDARSGAVLWRQSVKRARSESPHPLNGSATPSVATDGKHAFVFFPEFGLLAYDFEGKEKWKVALGPFGAVQGMAVSPVYAEGKVMLAVDTPEAAYVQAFDAATGKEAWKVERPMGVLGAYSTPSLYRPAKGAQQLVVAGTNEVTGYQISTGERLWWIKGITAGPAALPLVVGDSVYTLEPAEAGGPTFQQIAAPYDKDKDGKVHVKTEVAGDKINDKIMFRLFGSIDRHSGNNDGFLTEDEYNKAFDPNASTGGLVKTKLGGKGDLTASGVQWKHKKGIPYVTAALHYSGSLYVIRDGGILTVFDPESGKVLREERVKEAIGQYYASPVAGDGKVYLVSKDGKMAVLSAGQDWKVLSSAELGEDVIATPAISGRRIYVRSAGALFCFGAPEKG